MKRFLSLILAVTLVASLFTVNVMAAKDHSVTIDTETKTGLKSGDTIVVTVTVDSTENIQALGYALLYDTSAFSVDATQGWMSMKDYGMHENCIDQAWYDAMKGEPLGSILNPSVNAKDAGVIKFAGAGSMGIPAAVAATNYMVGKFTFTVKADAADGKYEFKLDDSVGESYSKEPGDNAGTLVTGNVLTVTVGEEKKDPAITKAEAVNKSGVTTIDGSNVRYDNAYEIKVTLTAAAGDAVGVEFVPSFMADSVKEGDIWQFAAETDDYSATLGAGTTEFRAALIGIPVDVKDAEFQMHARAFVKNSEGVKTYGDVVTGDFQYTIPK